MTFEITITMIVYLILGLLWTGTKHALAWEVTKQFTWSDRLRHMLFETAVWPYDLVDVLLHKK